MRITGVVVLLACFTPAVCYAPIFSGYPGMDRLVEKSDAIAVLNIYRQKTAFDRGYNQYEVQVFKMLKGKAPKGQTVTMSLRCLPRGLIALDFIVPGTYLVFLEKHDEKGISYRSVNAEGSVWDAAFPIDFKALDGLGPREAVREVLKESVANKRKALKKYEASVDQALKEISPDGGTRKGQMMRTRITSLRYRGRT